MTILLFLISFFVSVSSCVLADDAPLYPPADRHFPVACSCYIPGSTLEYERASLLLPQNSFIALACFSYGNTSINQLLSEIQLDLMDHNRKRHHAAKKITSILCSKKNVKTSNKLLLLGSGAKNHSVSYPLLEQLKERIDVTQIDEKLKNSNTAEALYNFLAYSTYHPEPESKGAQINQQFVNEVLLSTIDYTEANDCSACRLSLPQTIIQATIEHSVEDDITADKRVRRRGNGMYLPDNVESKGRDSKKKTTKRKASVDCTNKPETVCVPAKRNRYVTAQKQGQQVHRTHCFPGREKRSYHNATAVKVDTPERTNLKRKKYVIVKNPQTILSTEKSSGWLANVSGVAKNIGLLTLFNWLPFTCGNPTNTTHTSSTEGTPTSAPPPQATYTCDDGATTINNQQLCDKNVDCNDHTDEHPETCKTVCEESNGYYCRISRKCILAEQHCDKKFDCEHYDDEHYDECGCPDGFYCKYSQKCIEKDKLCDGKYDCDDKRGHTQDEDDKGICEDRLYESIKNNAYCPKGVSDKDCLLEMKDACCNGKHRLSQDEILSQMGINATQCSDDYTKSEFPHCNWKKFGRHGGGDCLIKHLYTCGKACFSEKELCRSEGFCPGHNDLDPKICRDARFIVNNQLPTDSGCHEADFVCSNPHNPLKTVCISPEKMCDGQNDCFGDPSPDELTDRCVQHKLDIAITRACSTKSTGLSTSDTGYSLLKMRPDASCMQQQRAKCCTIVSARLNNLGSEGTTDSVSTTDSVNTTDSVSTTNSVRTTSSDNSSSITSSISQVISLGTLTAAVGIAAISLTALAYCKYKHKVYLKDFTFFGLGPAKNKRYYVVQASDHMPMTDRGSEWRYSMSSQATGRTNLSESKPDEIERADDHSNAAERLSESVIPITLEGARFY